MCIKSLASIHDRRPLRPPSKKALCTYPVSQCPSINGPFAQSLRQARILILAFLDLEQNCLFLDGHEPHRIPRIVSCCFTQTGECFSPQWVVAALLLACYYRKNDLPGSKLRNQDSQTSYDSRSILIRSS